MNNGGNNGAAIAASIISALALGAAVASSPAERGAASAATTTGARRGRNPRDHLRGRGMRSRPTTRIPATSQLVVDGRRAHVPAAMKWATS